MRDYARARLCPCRICLCLYASQRSTFEIILFEDDAVKIGGTFENGERLLPCRVQSQQSEVVMNDNKLIENREQWFEKSIQFALGCVGWKHQIPSRVRLSVVKNDTSSDGIDCIWRSRFKSDGADHCAIWRIPLLFLQTDSDERKHMIDSRSK